MNRRQKSTKLVAKRAKAKLNKVKSGNTTVHHSKSKYISKADRAKLEAEMAATEAQNEPTAPSEESAAE
ncbi:DUF2986 domain-containing protein [Parashewanella spongiae]|uniref:DUF2986 domain-containing protein n=1 Tax=Parashewanella spongiae TaxID=342950 RepID=A0A3A6TWJ9_9GAMM|nr:DUF2986 domain-containing protein [Parashewanella spongiae]MCL1078274.1 DUF2986 domain-containing protein [Parashewanella spongiae]RJY18780.1 DUF2986 domain-containing protein [Parashewanella spongiae]